MKTFIRNFVSSLIVALAFSNLISLYFFLFIIIIIINLQSNIYKIQTLCSDLDFLLGFYCS